MLPVSLSLILSRPVHALVSHRHRAVGLGPFAVPELPSSYRIESCGGAGPAVGSCLDRPHARRPAAARLDHEQSYVDARRAQGLLIADMSGHQGDDAIARSLDAM